MAYDDFRHRIALRVRWAEVDMQSVVFNGHYLTYCDVCLTEYWRAIGLRYPEEFLKLGGDTFARKITIEYHAPARYDDELEVCGRTVRLGRSRLDFAISIFRKGELSTALIDAELIYVNVDLASHRSAPWPPVVREAIRRFEYRAPDENLDSR
jgi:acyl-CoA thioester hydrolase